MTDNDFKYLTKEFGYKNLELLKQKGAYPYEYMDSFKRFNEEKCFYRFVKDGIADNNGEKLDGHISDEDYLTCKKIWNEFKMKNVGDYYDHYLRKDVLLLADVFFSSPGLSWDAMLRMTGVKLEKIIDVDMYLFVEKGLRGGISYIAKRCSKANNEYMKNYGFTKPSKYISYHDMNNLYGWVVSGYLPYGGFKW